MLLFIYCFNIILINYVIYLNIILKALLLAFVTPCMYALNTNIIILCLFKEPRRTMRQHRCCHPLDRASPYNVTETL